MLATEHFDYIVIGAGSAGLTAAVGLTKAGRNVLLVEREHIGGECTNSGCIPSKALLHHAKTYHSAITTCGQSNISETYRNEAFTYVRGKVAEILQEETPETFRALGITVISGEATFVGPQQIQVGQTQYTYKTAIIATGSQPRTINIPGLNQADTLTNQNLFTLDTVPARTLIVGAGPIGLEMGQALALLGSTVTIITPEDTIARLEEPVIRQILHTQLQDLGIAIKCNSTITSVTNHTATGTQLHTDGSSKTFSVEFDKVLIAIGRTATLPAGLELAKINYDTFGITVNHNYRTSNKHVYAIGDVAAKLKFTHTADDAARQVIAHSLSRGILRINRQKAVPKVTYTMPEMAQVGMSFAEAVNIYGDDRLHRIEVPLSHNDRARTESKTNGVLIVIATRLRGQILGAHMIGPAAGEIISCFTLAIDQKISLWRLRATIFAYPTYSLIIKKAGDYFLAKQLTTLTADILKAITRFAPKLFLITIWAIGLYQLYSYQQTFSLTITELTLALFTIITTSAWAPLLYILAYAIRPLTFFPGTALTVLSGVFFGLTGGIIYTVIGANLSASLAYIVGRYFGKNLKLETSLVGNYVEALRKNPFTTTLTLRLLFMPFDVVNYGAGILRLPFLPYLLATCIGTLLGIATFVSLGASLNLETIKQTGIDASVIDGKFLLLSAVIFIASLVVAKIIPRMRENKATSSN